jgi:hypothetical protein
MRPQNPLELLGGQAPPQAPTRVLLGTRDELRAEAFSEQAIVRQATLIRATRGPVGLAHVSTIMRPTCPRTPSLVLMAVECETRPLGNGTALVATRIAPY